MSSPEFAQALRSELGAMYPDSPLVPIEGEHPLLTESFGGFSLALVGLRKPQQRAGGQPLETQLAEIAPRLEALTVQGRLIAVLSPIDITCSLTRGGSLEHETYLPLDAAKLSANVILYGLQRRSRLR